MNEKLKTIALTSIFTLTGVTAALASDVNWTYDGHNGPHEWGDLSPSFAACSTGVMQSPVDLSKTNAIGNVSVSVNYKNHPLTILNNGHTVQVNFDSGSNMTSGTTDYPLVQVHFHTPSEHVISGKSFPLVAHFVHATQDGDLSVIGLMFDEGKNNPELQKIIDVAPHDKAELRTIVNSTINPAAFFSDEIKVYRYMGSLTTPPCSEGVNWHIVKESVEASAEQIKAFADIMGKNVRPIMPLNNRLMIKPN